MQCHICNRSLNQASKCIICEEYVCTDHSRSFEVGSEKSEGSERKIYAYICDRCMETVEELKRKPRDEWTEEDKAKSKGMIGKILEALGQAGITIVAAIFTFALWLIAKGQKESGEEEHVSIADGGVKLIGFPSEPTGEASFAEQTTFKDGQKENAVPS